MNNMNASFIGFTKKGGLQKGYKSRSGFYYTVENSPRIERKVRRNAKRKGYVRSNF